MREARVDPAGRPLENRRRQGLQALGIVLGWIAAIAAIIRFSGGGDGGAASVPWLLGVGVLAWAAAEHVAGRRGLVWPGSALGIVGPLSVGLALSVITPEMRAAPPQFQMAVISGTAALGMGLFMFRFRLPGLVSPVVTFSIVALFLGLYGTDPAHLREVEGFSPRGILAAMMSSPLAAGSFAALSLASVAGARWLDLNGDDFGLAAARPLHVAGMGVFALVIGRWLAMLPPPLDLVLLMVGWVAATVWALRINRIAVLYAAVYASAKPVMLALGPILGFTFQRSDWGWLAPLILLAGMAIWPALHEQSLRRNWTLGPGGRIPQPRPNWWWRYWPYA
ncbi:MAG: hypothetical protein ACE5EU_08375 [Paracoccaceae bacterium]